MPANDAEYMREYMKSRRRTKSEPSSEEPADWPTLIARMRQAERDAILKKLMKKSG